LWVHDRNGKDKGTTRKISYKIELAPPDQDSAQKWQNRKLGITVRNLTYEVRHALNRTADEPGVLVAKVESGSPTLVARIFPNEIIVRLGETPVTSAKHLRDLIAAANKNGLDKVRLTILRLGKTRFADLQIDEYDPADDEGLEEDDE
jgi:S1-C subfamily serine protease